MRTVAKVARAIGCMLALSILLTPAISGCTWGRAAVPDVAGMTQPQAVRALQDAGFKLGEIRAVVSNQVAQGMVVSTEPPAGTKLASGSTVSLSVNTGISAEIVVPDLVGLGQSAAEEQLKSVSLTPIAAEAYSTTVTAGQVLAQVPAPGTKLAADDQVVIQVSKGPAPKKVSVPNVVGKTQSAATDTLKNAGFTTRVVSVYDSAKKGTVISQQPEAGTQLVSGSEVALAVSLGKGVGAVTVPNVVGKKEADATKALQSANLKPKVYRQNSDSVAKGVVIGQLPKGGSTTATGAEVGVVVSLGPAADSGNVAVPSVVGKAVADATAALEAAGFSVQVVEQSSTSAPGTVTQQLPVAGSTAPSGSIVVVAVPSAP